jgi:hypothetical protein
MGSRPDIDGNREGTCLGIIEMTWNTASRESYTGVRLAGAPVILEGNARPLDGTKQPCMMLFSLGMYSICFSRDD